MQQSKSTTWMVHIKKGASKLQRSQIKATLDSKAKTLMQCTPWTAFWSNMSTWTFFSRANINRQIDYVKQTYFCQDQADMTDKRINGNWKWREKSKLARLWQLQKLCSCLNILKGGFCDWFFFSCKRTLEDEFETEREAPLWPNMLRALTWKSSKHSRTRKSERVNKAKEEPEAVWNSLQTYLELANVTEQPLLCPLGSGGKSACNCASFSVLFSKAFFQQSSALECRHEHSPPWSIF